MPEGFARMVDDLVGRDESMDIKTIDQAAHSVVMIRVSVREKKSVDATDPHRPEGLGDRLVAALVVSESACIVEPVFVVWGLDQHACSVPDIDEGGFEFRSMGYPSGAFEGFVSQQPERS